MSEKNKTKKGKSSSTIKATKEVRCLAHTISNLHEPYLFIVSDAITGSSSPRSQKQKQPTKIRSKKSNKSLSQMSSSPTPQRKLLRLKNSPNKRNGVERVYSKSKAGNNKNRSRALRTDPSRVKLPPNWGKIRVNGKLVDF